MLSLHACMSIKSAESLLMIKRFIIAIDLRNTGTTEIAVMHDDNNQYIYLMIRVSMVLHDNDLKICGNINHSLTHPCTVYAKISAKPSYFHNIAEKVCKMSLNW